MELENSGTFSHQDPESSLQIYREVFDLCDKDGNGFITKSELSHICNQVSDEDVASSVLDNVMVCLDSNHDGRISFEEFKAGFEAFQRLQSGLSPSSSSTPLKPPISEEVYESDPVESAEEGVWREVMDRIDPQQSLAGTGVEAVWKELNRRDPALLESFEGFLAEVISELKQSDLEKSTLQSHVKKILEQRSREATEMDDMLQQELQLAKANHQKTNANQSSRLSNHYSSLLAEREAVIEELSTQETDLKEALQQKTRKESQLKEEKTFLLSANKVLQEKLETTLNSDLSSGSGSEGGHSQQGSVEEESDGVDGLEGDEPLLPEDTDVTGGNEGGVSRVGDEYGKLTSPEASLRLNVIQEASDGQQDEIKYYPPKKSSLHHLPTEALPVASPAQLVSNHSKDADSAQATRASTQGTVEYSQQGDADSSQGTAGSSQRPRGSLEGSVSSPRRGGSSRGTVSNSRQSGTVDNPDMSLTISGVMPRRGELPSSSSESVSRVFKVIFLGECCVGKTSLIAFLREGEFSGSVVSTVGLDYSIKTLRVGEERVIFQLWDTAGQERFRNALAPVYFRRADAFVLVYDVTNRDSFKAIKKWISIIKAALREQPSVIMLVGNKSDKVSERSVTVEDGQSLALELQALFSEMSALSGDNVLQAHSTLAQLLLARENADLCAMNNRATANPEESSNCAC